MKHIDKMKHKFNVEVTDTFGGEANYSWVRRYEFEMPDGYTDRQLTRAAKAVAGMSGVRGERMDEWDGFTFRPYGLCRVMFCNLATP